MRDFLVNLIILSYYAMYFRLSYCFVLIVILGVLFDRTVFVLVWFVCLFVVVIFVVLFDRTGFGLVWFVCLWL